MERTWKRIPGFSLYEASDLGEIRTHNWKNKGITRVMKPALDAGGYLRTVLKSDDGKYVTIKVHRIIAQTFIENPENKPVVNHINGIPNDNRVSNLEWCTLSENSRHSFQIGISSNKGEHNPAATLTDDQVREILSNYQFGKKGRSGITKQQLADKYNTSFTVIKQIVQRKTWKHLSSTSKTSNPSK